MNVVHEDENQNEDEGEFFSTKLTKYKKKGPLSVTQQLNS